MCSIVKFLKNFFNNCDVDVDCGTICKISHGNDFDCTTKKIHFIIPENMHEDLIKHLNNTGINYNYSTSFYHSRDGYINDCFLTFGDSYNTYRGYDHINCKIEKTKRIYTSENSHYGTKHQTETELEWEINKIKCKPKLIIIKHDKLQNIGWLNLFKIVLQNDFSNSATHGFDILERCKNLILTQIQERENKFKNLTLNDILLMWNDYLEILEIEKFNSDDLIKDTVKKYNSLFKLGFKPTKPDFTNMTQDEILKLNFKYYDIIKSVNEL